MEDTVQVDLWSKVTGAPGRCQRVGVTSFKKSEKWDTGVLEMFILG